jgi:GntR family transcriptional regulator / MocR family aminotransferase
MPAASCDSTKFLRLREALAAMLSATRGLAVDPSSVLVTRGSQMALALVARALTRPGDAIAVEHPGYRPAWEAFRMARAEIVPVRVDEHGVDVEALQRVIARRSIRAVYVTPHHQYPTTVTLTAPRRLALLQLAAQERFAIIEDDYDHEFHYSGRPVLPMASADAAGLVIYIGTLSKVLAPGLRLGFIVAPDDLIERLVAYRSFVDLQGDPVLECAIAELFEDGLIQRHVRKMRRIYRARLEILAAALRIQLGRFLTPSAGSCSKKTFRLTRLTPRDCIETYYGKIDSIMNDLIILTALLPGASYGYAIKKTAGRVLGHSELHSNVVYPLLRKFVEQGWVEQSIQPGERGQQRKQYRLTPAGRAELVRRLEHFDDEAAGDRADFMLRVSMFGVLSPAARRNVVEKRCTYLERRLKQLRSLEPQARSSRFGGLVLSFSLSGMEHELAWLEEVERQLRARPKTKSTRKDKPR